MSVKHSILGLLAASPRSGYQLKKDFEELTANIWPLNDGQVYTTLQRLQRDGLVVESGDDALRRFEVTDAGRAELDQWVDAVRPPMTPDRDELVIKVALALEHPGVVDTGRLRGLLHLQRRAATAALQDLTRQIARLRDHERAQASVLDAAAARLDAELRWLDAVEARLRTDRTDRTDRPTGGAT